MLVPKQTPEVAVLKLSNNDEIIVNIISADATEYTVENPFVLVMGQTGQMQYSPMLIMASDAPMQITKSYVVAKAKPSANMLTGYEKATGKIVLPPKQGIII